MRVAKTKRALAGQSFNLRTGRSGARRIPANCGLAIWRITQRILRAILAPLDEEVGSSVETRAARIRVLDTAVLLLAGIVSWRLYDVQGMDANRWKHMASQQHRTSLEIRGVRGEILDAEGRVLATSVQGSAIGVHPRQIRDVERVALELSELLGETPSDILPVLKKNVTFTYLAHGLPAHIGDQVADMDLAGVTSFPEYRRFYPHGSLAGPILGRVSRDGFGQAGVELNFEKQLRAPSIHVPVRRDARGRLVTASVRSKPDFTGFHLLKAVGEITNPEPEADPALREEGETIQLSIDSVLQKIVEEELLTARESAKAKQVFGLVADAMTGEILAMGQSSGYDPNSPQSTSPAAFRNMVLQDSFEPGSTFKPIVAALALEEKVAQPTEIMNCENGSYRVGKYTVRDVHPVGIASFADVLIRSSNVCMTKLGQRLGRERLARGIEQFGFGKPTGVELPGEAQGILRPQSTWAEIDVATHSFGQGVAVTALQLVQAYGALANGGELIPLTILKTPRGQHTKARRVLSKTVAQTIAQMLQGVTTDEHGTGRKAAINGIEVSGKTGTAEKARRSGRGYDPDKVLSSFIGFLDGTSVGVPRTLVMYVAVDEPNVRPRWGGTLAAPVFRRSMERILSYLMTQEVGGVQTAKAPGEPVAARM